MPWSGTRLLDLYEKESAVILYFLPLLLVILSNTFYHITSKSTPADVNPLASLCVTYLVAAAATFVLMLIRQGVAREELFPFKGINWTSFVLGICIIGLEYGYLWAYRVGWDISIGSLIANIALAVILIAVGLLLFKEKISATQLIGVALCMAGLVFIQKK